MTNLDFVDGGRVLLPAEVKTSILNIFPESPSESAFMLCTTYGDNTPDLSGKMLILVLQQPNTTFSLMALERLCRTRTGVSCCSVTCHHKIKQPDVGIPLHYGMKQHNSFLYLPKFFKPVQDISRNRFCSHTKCCVSLSLLLFSLLQASDVPLGHKTQRVYSHLKFEFEING